MLTLNDVGFGSGAPPVGNSDGTITISAGPVGLYGSTPAPGATLTFGPVLGGSPAPTQSITINNDGGDPGSTLTGTCALSGPDAGTFTITTDGAFSIAQGGAGDTETVSCATGVNGTFTASLDCSHDGSNASPASYPLTCTVNPPFANVVPTPANGTQRTILVPAIGGMGNTSVTFNETENNGVDGSIDTCSISGVDAAQFTVTAPAAFPATVPAGGSVQVTVNGVEPGTGMPVAAALDCTLGDGIGGTTAVSFPLQFLVQPQVVPTLNQWAMILMGLFLAGAGFFTLRPQGSVSSTAITELFG